MIAEVKQQHTVAALVGLRGPLQQFQSRAVQTVTKNDERLSWVSGIPQAPQDKAIACIEFNRLHWQPDVLRVMGAALWKSKSAVRDEIRSADGQDDQKKEYCGNDETDEQAPYPNHF